MEMTTLIRSGSGGGMDGDNNNIGAKRRKPLKTNKVTQQQQEIGEINIPQIFSTSSPPRISSHHENNSLLPKSKLDSPDLQLPLSLPFTPTLGTTTLVQPISASGDTRIYRCPQCQALLNSQKEFTSHIRGHNEVKPHPDPNDPTGQAKVYYCCLCGKMLSSFSSLDRHMLVHSGERPFSCALCGQTFTTNGNMHRHKRTHIANRGPDGVLENGLNTAPRRVGRKRKTSEERQRQAAQSNLLLKSIDKNGSDQILVHSSSNSYNNNSPLLCPICEDPYFSEVSLESHIISIHPGVEMKCSQCEYKSLNYGYFKAHRSVFHQGFNKPKSFSSSDLSSSQFPQLTKALTHLEDSSNNQKGEEPPEEFSSHPPCKISKSEESDDDSSSINPSMSDNDPYIKDMKLKGEFPCRLCPAIYPNLRALKGHNKEHCDKAPFLCNVGACLYSSSDKMALSRHMRGHTGEKPYECKICSYEFTTKANCERHLRNKHGKISRDAIRDSIAVHHENHKPPTSKVTSYRCKVCKNTFPSSDSVIEHALKEHPAYSGDANHIYEEITVIKTFSSADEDDEDDFEEYEEEDVEEGEDCEEEAMMDDTEDRRSITEPSSPLPTLRKAPCLNLVNRSHTANNNNISIRNESEEEAPLDLSQNKKSRESEAKKEVGEDDLSCHPFLPNSGANIPLFPSGFPYIIQQHPSPASIPRPAFPFIFPHIGGTAAAAAAAAAAAIMGNPSLDTREILQTEWMKHRLVQPFNFNPLCCPPPPPPPPQGAAGGIPPTTELKIPPPPHLTSSSTNVSRSSSTNSSGASNGVPQLDSSHAKNEVNDEKVAVEALQRLSAHNNPKKASSSIPLLIPKIADNKMTINHSSPSSHSDPGRDKDNDQNLIEYKMVIKNGVLMKKQKQRRYRTERPYGCQHCSARFTLRSNMERHIKQQHPDHWCQKPRGNRRHHSSSSRHDYDRGEDEGKNSHGGSKLVIDEDIKGDEDDDLELECGSPNHHLSKDDGLASVSKLLNAVSKRQMFPKLFDPGDNENHEAHGSVKTLKCPYCREAIPWTSSSAFRSHLATTHLGGKCAECSRWLSSREEFDKHTQTEHGQALPPSEDEIHNLQFSCPVCEVSPGFSKREDGLLHLQINHSLDYEAWMARGVFKGALNDGDESNGEELDSSERFIKRCSLCTMGFPSNSQLKKHFLEHLGSLETCLDCGLLFTLHSSYEKHRKKVHEDPLPLSLSTENCSNNNDLSSKFKKRANLMDKINKLSISISTNSSQAHANSSPQRPISPNPSSPSKTNGSSNSHSVQTLKKDEDDNIDSILKKT